MIKKYLLYITKIFSYQIKLNFGAACHAALRKMNPDISYGNIRSQSNPALVPAAPYPMIFTNKEADEATKRATRTRKCVRVARAKSHFYWLKNSMISMRMPSGSKICIQRLVSSSTIPSGISMPSFSAASTNACKSLTRNAGWLAPT